MVLCLIVGCGSKSGRDKGLYFARVPSVVTNQGEEAQERVSMGEWLLRLTVNILAFLRLTVIFFPLRLTGVVKN